LSGNFCASTLVSGVDLWRGCYRQPRRRVVTPARAHGGCAGTIFKIFLKQNGRFCSEFPRSRTWSRTTSPLFPPTRTSKLLRPP